MLSKHDTVRPLSVLACTVGTEEAEVTTASVDGASRTELKGNVLVALRAPM